MVDRFDVKSAQRVTAAGSQITYTGPMVRHSDYAALEAQLAERVEASIAAASEYCWQRYKGREPMNLKSPAVFTSHEHQKIAEHIRSRLSALEATPPAPKVTESPWTVVQRGYEVWAAKPHNKKWVKRLDGTPISNDLIVCIVSALTAAQESGE